MFRNVIFILHKGSPSWYDDNISFNGTFENLTYNGEDRSILFLGTRENAETKNLESVLYYPDGTAPTTIGAFRAYFKLADGLTAGDPEVPEAPFVRSFNLNFGGEEQTGIIDAPRIADRKKPAADNAVYDLQGRRVGRAEANSSLFTLRSSLKKGLYINGHRKVVLK